MKTVSNDYTSKEEASTRKPLELYRIWYGSTYWYHTNGDVAVDFDGHTYTPATLQRESAQYDDKLDANTMAVQFERAMDPIVDYIASNPVEIVWIEISRLFRDQDPLEKSVIFLGQVASVSVKDLSAKVNCVGFEFFLSQDIPMDRYQPQCNWTLFDSRCKRSSAGYVINPTGVIVSANGREIIHPDFAQSSQYWRWGRLIYQGAERLITWSAGNTIKIRHSIKGLVTGENVTAYPGCDGSIVTCDTKFSNKIHFGGHPTLPIDNPTTWVEQ